MTVAVLVSEDVLISVTIFEIITVLNWFPVYLIVPE
jgi:hypothetical protein